MRIALERTGTATAFGRLLASMAAHDNVAGIMVLACDANGFTPDTVDLLLGGCPLPVFGGIFPEILYDGKRYTKGTLVVGLPVRPTVAAIPDLSAADVDYEAAIAARLDTDVAGDTMFVWVDGLATNIHAVVESLFHVFGLDVNYVGGGAGALSFARRPCVMTNQGLLGDAAVLALVDIAGSVGVRHGWQSVRGPFTVTEASHNVIETLNWLPAFDVYAQVIAETSGRVISAANFFDVAKAYPFGIHRLGAEQIVRDPIQLGPRGALICVGDVPVGVHLDILTGTPDSLIQAAATALDDARHGAAATVPGQQVVLAIDCISRTLFLEDDFDRELAALSSIDAPMFGALTLGEIANNGRDFLEFYNKTAVVSILAGSSSMPADASVHSHRD